MLDLLYCHDLKVELGELYVNFGSVHVYEDKFALVVSMIKNGISPTFLQLNVPIPLNNVPEWYEKNLEFYNLEFKL
jgi:thymidylate synthase